MSKIIKLSAPALILPDRGIDRAMMEQPCQQQQGHFSFGMIVGTADDGPPSTWDPLFKGPSVVLSNANLTATSGGGGDGTTRGTKSKTAGDLYFEVKQAGASNFAGIVNSSALTTSYPGSNSNGVAYASNGSIFYNGTIMSGLATSTTGDVTGIAVSFAAGKIWFLKNGVAITGDPVAKTGGHTLPSGALYPAVDAAGGTYTLTLKAVAPFDYAAPSGYLPWG